MEKKHYTIKDISRLTNFSRGTIDKVLHNRGGVSQETIDKVQRVIEQVGYTPNTIAKSLKNHKTLTLAVLMPEHEAGGYWGSCAAGIKRAQTDMLAFGGHIQYHYYQRTIANYQQFLQNILATPPDALLIAPIDYPDVRPLYQALGEAGIPFAFINSKVENTPFSSFVGQNYVSSGRLAAQMMQLLAPLHPRLLILHQAEELELSSHLLEKENGFRAYFQEKEANLQISSHTRLRTSSNQELPFDLNDFDGLYLTTSTAYEAIATHSLRPDIKIIGYDLTPASIQGLTTGKITLLLHQNPGRQAYWATKFLLDHLVFQTPIPAQKYLPIEMVARENLASYLPEQAKDA